MKILKTTDLSQQYIKMLSYGAPGSGKTTLAGSMATSVKTIGLSAESGLLSLRNIVGPDGKPLPIDYVNIEKFEDMEEAFRFLKLSKHDYQGVFIDSITEIQKACKDWIMEKSGRDMEMRDWGTLANKIERMVRSFRDLPMHVNVTALEESETDKLTGEMRVLPALQGSVQRQLPAYFDLVLYCFAKEIGEGEDKKIKHHVLTRNSGKYIGKDRSGKLPSVIQDPTFAKIYDMIFGNNKEETNEGKVRSK